MPEPFSLVFMENRSSIPARKVAVIDDEFTVIAKPSGFAELKRIEGDHIVETNTGTIGNVVNTEFNEAEQKAIVTVHQQQPVDIPYSDLDMSNAFHQ